MTAGKVSMNVRDRGTGLGAAAASEAARRVVLVGITAGGTPGQIRAYTSKTDLIDEQIGGSTVELAASILDVAGGEVLISPAEITTPGAVGTVTQAGDGLVDVTMAGAARDAYELVVKIERTGRRGVGTFRFSDDGGDNFGAEITIPSGGTYLLGATNVTATFPALSAVTSSGTTPPVITVTGTTTDDVDLQVECTTGGALTTWVFRYSIDGGTTWTSNVTSAATVAVGATGLTLNIAAGSASTNNVWLASNQYIAGDTWSAPTTAPGASTASIAAAMDEVHDDGRRAKFGVVVGSPSGATDADRATSTAALLAAVDAKAQAADADNDPMHWIVDGPLPVVDTTKAGLTAHETALAAVVAPLVSEGGRVATGGGSYDHLSAVDLAVRRRSAAWAAAIWAAKGTISQDISEVDRGALGTFVRAIYGDGRVRPALEAARIISLRTWRGRRGFYLTSGITLAANGSDFTYLHAGVVMDFACFAAYDEMVRFVGKGLRVTGTTGRLDPRAADAADMQVGAAVAGALDGHVTSSAVTVNRLDDVKTLKKLRFKVSLDALFYPREVDADLSYSTPATAISAAA